MKVGIAYFSVVLIWATTPLAIKMSNSSVTFVSAVASRVFIALVILLATLAVLRRPLIKKRSDWHAYFAGLIGAFPNMLLIYWAAQYIPSGVAAVIFGIYPFMVGIFSYFILKENIFNARRVVAIMLALAGLVIINIDQFNLGGNALYGVLGVVMATAFFGLSSVWVKHVGADIDPLRQSTGVLVLIAPLIAVSWFIFDGELPTHWDSRSILGVGYSAAFGSVIGSVLFFYVLANCKVASVGLITFITPVVALFVGSVFDGEQFSQTTIFGCVLVIVALGVYQNALRLIARTVSDWFVPKHDVP